MTEMSTHPSDELLADLAVDVLAPHDAEPVRAHVDRCATCTGVVRALSDVGEVLQALPEPPLPVGLHDRVLEAVRHAGGVTAVDVTAGVEQEPAPRGDVVAVPSPSAAGGEDGAGDGSSRQAGPGVRRPGVVRTRRSRTGRARFRWGALLGAAAALLLLAVVGLGQVTDPSVQTTAGPPPAPDAGAGSAPQDGSQRESEATSDEVPDETSEVASGGEVQPESETVPDEAPGVESGREHGDGHPSGAAPLGDLPVFAADPGPVSPDTVLQSIRRRPELTRAYETALDAGATRSEGAGVSPSLTSCPGVDGSGGIPAFFLTSDGPTPTTLVVVLPGGDVLLLDVAPDDCVGEPGTGDGVAPGSD